MVIEIKRVSTDEANVSERTVTFDIFVDGKFIGFANDSLEALQIKNELLDPTSQRGILWRLNK